MHLFFACPSCSHSPQHTFCCVAATSKKHFLASTQLFTYCHSAATHHNTHYNMNFNEQDNIQNQLQSLNQKKNIQCPGYKSSLFHFDGMPFFSSVRIINDIVLIHHSQCQSSIGMCGKALYFCLSCGSQSSHTSGRLQDTGCKQKMLICKKPMKGYCGEW